VTISSIVVGTDGSETAALAVETAADLAASFGARVHLVSAYKPAAVRIAEADSGPEVQDWMVGATTEVEAVLQEAAGAVLARNVELESYARKGDPATALLDVAEEKQADLIVVGNKGMQGTTRFLIGSVPDKLSHHAACSVLIVRTA
jgi:nucleotide-binding universal stress UspA family protein